MVIVRKSAGPHGGHQRPLHLRINKHGLRLNVHSLLGRLRRGDTMYLARADKLAPVSYQEQGGHPCDMPRQFLCIKTAATNDHRCFGRVKTSASADTNMNSHFTCILLSTFSAILI